MNHELREAGAALPRTRSRTSSREMPSDSGCAVWWASSAARHALSDACARPVARGDRQRRGRGRSLTSTRIARVTSSGATRMRHVSVKCGIPCAPVSVTNSACASVSALADRGAAPGAWRIGRASRSRRTPPRVPRDRRSARRAMVTTGEYDRSTKRSPRVTAASDSSRRRA